MFQNIRVDTVYYNTNTDFEMEFNLCGCCRMRLLTDKVSEKKTFLHSLARAVSRSKVIIVTGKLFGDNGIIRITASAIGSKLELADNKNYGIASDEKIEIVKDSIPLVTPEGYFGGCILENGPQTMIIISDNKNIRKSIMKNLIHPYIEELYAGELKEKSSTGISLSRQDEVIEEESIIDEGTEVVSECIKEDSKSEESEENEGADDEEIADELNDITQEELQSEEVDDEESSEQNFESDSETDLYGGMIFESDDEEYEKTEESDFFVKPLLIKKKDMKNINSSYYDFENEEESDIECGEFANKSNVSSLTFNIPILIISVFILLLIAFLSFFIFYVPTRYGSTAQECIYEIYTTLFGK